MFNRRTNLPEEELRDLYLNQGLTIAEIAARYSIGATSVRRRLSELGITSRPRGPKGSRDLPHGELSEQLLRELYLGKKLSIPQIAELCGWGRETIRQRMIEYGIPIRSFSQATLVQHGTWDEYHDFSGDEREKAYLLGFRLGDLTVRYEKESSEVMTIGASSTRREQIELIQSLYKPYGHVNVTRRLQLATNGFIQYHIRCSVNSTFEFLLDYISELPDWIRDSDENFLAFFGGFTDAEGSFFIQKQKKSVDRSRFSIKNTDLYLLQQCHSRLSAFGIHCSSITKVYDAGRQTSKRGVFATKALWAFAVDGKESVLLLISLVGSYIRHEKRRADMDRVRQNVEWRNSDEFREEATRKRVEAMKKTNEVRNKKRN